MTGAQPEGKSKATLTARGEKSQPPQGREDLAAATCRAPPLARRLRRSPEYSQKGGTGQREPPRPLCLHVSQMTREESLPAGTARLSAGSV